MTPTAAMTLLDLTADTAASVRHIRAAWARHARACHPDTAPEHKAQAAQRLQELGEARDLLIRVAEDQKSTCAMCQGKRMVRGVVGWRPCGACGGDSK